MKTFRRQRKAETAAHCLAGGFALALGIVVSSSLGFAKSRPAPDPQSSVVINVRVYDYAHVEPHEWVRAQAEATRILLGAGIQTVWFDCPIDSNAPNDHACHRPLRTADLVVRILPQAMADRLLGDDPSLSNALGYAHQSTDREPSFLASIFYHRVQMTAKYFRISLGVMLGHALAHEVGHLLLGPGKHSVAGIMRAVWRGKEAINASAGGLLFVPQQAAAMRAEVRARLTADTH